MERAVDLDRYDAAALADREGAKWALHGTKALAAWVADMDFPVAPEIVAALLARVEHDDLGYPDPSLDASVRAGFAAHVSARHGHVVDPEDVVLVSDVVQAIYLSLLTLTEPGDGVVFLTPAYPPFFTAAVDTGRRALTCDLVSGGDRYEIDLDALEALVRSERPTCLLLCNPHNPTGRCFTRPELARIAELARAAGLVVLSDEIHGDLTLPGATHVPFATVSADAAARSVTFGSASKAYNVAGLRCAVAAFGSAPLRERFESFPARARGDVGIAGMIAAVTAWAQCDWWLDAVLGELAANRGTVTAWAAARSDAVRLVAPEATYLAWLDLREANIGDDPASWLLEHAGVALSPGPAFGDAGRGFARLNFATSRPVLDEILRRLAVALDGRE
ncbi:MAG TPA: aminotransferase class I/II-fold pyridoxal phosphate-dependent enzyme [Acidimicrobiales bacterium]|nr:aminotransferase class I/II-fold pyridoxal phosphate-dependent enzyme [Acidimicrobiales bacterium]